MCGGGELPIADCRLTIGKQRSAIGAQPSDKNLERAIVSC
jgi:hypothetical protein